MEKTLFKKRIPDIVYTPIFNGINILDPPDNIYQVKSVTRKCRDKLNTNSNF